MNNIPFSPDYNGLSSPEHDALNSFSKLNGFPSGPFRTSTSFTPRARNLNSRDTPTNPLNAPGFGQPPVDLLGGASQLAAAQGQMSPYAFETMHSGRLAEYSMSPGQLSNGGPLPGSSQAKSMPFGPLDAYGHTLDAPLLPTHQQRLSGAVTNGQLSQSLHQIPQSYGAPFTNGISQLGAAPHAPVQQTPFGPTLSAVTSSAAPSAGAQGTGPAGASGMGHGNANAQSSQPQEEISTIFVVGFPDDMQEREFQNMFTFSSGFEAATLKIPNKDYSAYGAGNNRSYPGSNDPYNLVTVNQGGVLVDGGRDGTTTSWPNAQSMQDVPQSNTRKQIIGFAKFRTRQEALDARDTLQGRRVDLERGSVLKAEMAKKNLHTKRGPNVPPNGFPVGNGAATAPPDSYSALNGMGSANTAAEPFVSRERELGAIGAMGLAGLGQRRERVVESREDERRQDLGPVGGLPGIGSRGARERAEEEERERKRKEKEAQRLRQNSFAFEAFHSVPQQMVRQGANSLLSAESGQLPNGMNLPSPPSIHGMMAQPELSHTAWSLRDLGASAAMRKMTTLATNLPPQPPSPPTQLSPDADVHTNPSAPLSASSLSGGNNSPTSLPGHPSLPSRPRPFSPGDESQLAPGLIGSMPVPVTANVSVPPSSSASSVSGSQSGIEDDLSQSVAALSVGTNHGTTSPQLPSPSSGASSGTGRNLGDHNPPINTLYVGNLPTSAATGVTSLSFLEDRLRDLFSKRPGYRKLVFRQKSNGPMCFVEFEDVSFATRAISELSGNTLNGLVKNGGIRLSYSKNPLGVRGPTNTANNASSASVQQQQQFVGDAFALDTGRALRRDMSGMASPTSSYHYTTSPPPRFVSPPPPPASFSSLSSTAAFPRATSQGFSLALGGSASFSPFGISPSHSATIPDQPSVNASHDHLRNTTPSPANLEANRVG